MRFLRYISLSLAVVLLGACSDWLDVNEDPSNPTNVDPKLVLPAAEASLAITLGGEIHNMAGYFCQYWTQSPSATQYQSYDTYDVNTSVMESYFNELYSGALNDFKNVEMKAKESGNEKQQFVAGVLSVYTYQIMLDLFDKVPYSEALDPSNLSPNWDSGEDVYKALITKIDELLQMDLTKGTFTSGDLFLSEDMDNWRKFAKTLQLKLMLRVSYAAGLDYSTKIKALVTEDDLLTQSVGLDRFEDNTNKRNPWSDVNVYRLGTETRSINHIASTTILDFMMSNGDDRYMDLFSEAKNGGYHANYPGAAKQGVKQFLKDGVMKDGNKDDFSFVKYPYDRPCYLFILPEIHFMKAEVYLRFFNDPTTAKTCYDDGVTASFAMHETSVGTLLDMGNVYHFDTGATMEAQLQMLMTQKWISLAHYNNFEGWCELRRTKYPNYSSYDAKDPMYISGQIARPYENNINASGSDRFPRRVFFPDSEYSRNINMPDQINDLTVKVWWDQRTQVVNP